MKSACACTWCLVFLLQPARGQGPEKVWTAADAWRQASADLAELAPELRPLVRYLSLHNLPAAARPDAARVLAAHVNGLSRAADIQVPHLVPGTAAALVRVNLEDYAWAPAVWEALAAADPYYHVQLVKEVLLPGGQVKTLKFRRALAPWLGEAPLVAQVVAQTGSRLPVVRADWFFNQTAAAADRTPNYYTFLGVGSEKDFQEMIGFEPRLAARFGKELREAVADSGVTLQPRAILRHNTLGGGYWRTFDFRVAEGKGNPLRVLGQDVEAAYDASEQFGHLPNGWWATGLFDRAGKIQAAAPDFVASDSHARGNDRRVHVNVSCLRCHADAGLQEIDGWARNLLQPPLGLQGPDYKTLRALRQQYLRQLEPFLARDRAVFAQAVQEATGWTPKVFAAKYAAAWEAYEDGRIDLARAARDLGVSPPALTAALTAQLKEGTIDAVLSVFLLEGPRRRTIGIRQWEEVFPTAAALMHGGK